MWTTYEFKDSETCVSYFHSSGIDGFYSDLFLRFDKCWLWNGSFDGLGVSEEGFREA